MSESKGEVATKMTDPSKSPKGLCKRCCSSFRWFHSKGAALVLVWTFLIVATHRLLYLILDTMDSERIIVLSTSVCIFVAAPFFGWLADAKLGNYKVVKIGITVSWLASVLVSLFTLLYYNTSLRLSGDQSNVVVKTILLAIIGLIHWTGSVILVNILQLSLEQIPDASAENITSLISWLTLSTIMGVWVGNTIRDLLLSCVPYNLSDVYQVLTLFPVICASINFVSFHLVSPRWLILEPKSPQSLKNIYRVLKFAAKHKAPLNRSALTYWEEDIPSRLDLGKSRYGGPFTTEQVEDVKTFFRILAVSVGIFLTLFALGLHENIYFSSEVFNVTNFSPCEASALFSFTLHPGWCGVLAVLVYEFLLYPCFKHRLPSSMKRIGIASFVVMLRNMVLLTVSILMYFNIVGTKVPVIMGIKSCLLGVLVVAIAIPSVEFICAQAPYNMRGLMSGYIQLNFWLGYILGNVVTFEIGQFYQTPIYFLVNASVGATVSVIALFLYLIIAFWYKRRVRDDIDTPHKWVEDVYDRYLTAAVNN